MKNCKEFEEDLSEMVFGEISEERQFELHDHLATCEPCMEFYLSLYETLADTEGEEIAEGLTSKQKARILATACQMDEENNETEVEKKFE